MKPHLPYHKVTLPLGQEIEFLGPPLTAGPLPALFYFALSAEDSLCLDPFNQPAVYLSSLPLRIFSLTLPGHENHLPPTQALHLWAQEFKRGHNVITSFVERVHSVVEWLRHHNYLQEEKVAISGLSRGAFIATHIAAHIPLFRTILGFAPLTQLGYAKEFETIAELPAVKALQLEQLIDNLTDRTLRFYIGNVDTRVSTRLCFEFVDALARATNEQRTRSPQVELIIGPSIGHQGHGTAKTTFHHGAQWIAEKLQVINVL